MVATGTPSSILAPTAPPMPRRAGRVARWLRWRNSPRVTGLIAVLVLVPLFVSLGQWQWQKGERKAAQQALRDARGGHAELSLPTTPVAAGSPEAEALQFRRLHLTGRFLPERQFLLDNRVHRQHVGFHVVTPFELDGGQAVVLVNRGWVPGGASHRAVPTFVTPEGRLALHGVAVQPPRRFFSLSASGNTPDWAPAAGVAASAALPRTVPGLTVPALTMSPPTVSPPTVSPPTVPPVWQHLDVDAFARQSGLPVHGVIVQLDATSSACFMCDWPRPDERIERHYSYALQWFGFALTAVGIWLFFVFRGDSE